MTVMATLDELKSQARAGALPASEATIRDYFAIHAASGLLANGWCSERRECDLGGYEEVAVEAYVMAEAMLKVRGK